MDKSYRYKAFISYSHADESIASWLHRRIESYRTPKALIGREGRRGTIPERLRPVFRDREELTASSELGTEIQRALDSSEFLIVLCSPASASSHWVNEEIRHFRKLFGYDRVLAIIVDGIPGAPVGPDLDGCFPPALLAPDEGTDVPREPIAADVRNAGDGRRMGLLKLVSGLLGVGLDDLVQRDNARKQKRMALVTGGSLSLTAVMIVLALYANQQRQLAEQETATANATLNYVIGLFQILNPATEDPTTIKALTILDRGRQGLDQELRRNPRVKARLLSTFGSIYANLGLVAEADRTLEEALEQEGATPLVRFTTLLQLTRNYTIQGRELDKAEDALARTREAWAEWGPDGENILPDPHFQRGQMHVSVADIAIENWEWEAAKQAFESALKSYSQSPQAHSEEEADIYARLGTVLADLGEPVLAKQNLEIALGIQLEKSGEEHFRTAEVMHNLGYALLSGDNTTGAINYIEKALTVYNRVLQSEHPAMADAYLLRARIAEVLEDYPAAIQAYENAINVLLTLYDENHAQTGFARVALSKALVEHGSFDRAFSELGIAKIVYDYNFPEDPVNTGDWMIYHAYALGLSGETDAAEAQCEVGMALILQDMNETDTYVQDMKYMCESVASLSPEIGSTP